MFDIEPKGLDLPKRKLPTELKRVEEKHKKPPPEFNPTFWDGLGGWLEDAVVNVAAKVVERLIPDWFWFALFGVVILGIIALIIILL